MGKIGAEETLARGLVCLAARQGMVPETFFMTWKSRELSHNKRRVTLIIFALFKLGVLLVIVFNPIPNHRRSAALLLKETRLRPAGSNQSN